MQNAIGKVLAGRRVEAVSGGGRLDITLDGPVTVRVAHEFVFAVPSEVDHFFPALTFRPSGTLLGLVGRTVGAARVTMAGGLELAFDGDAVLSVPPHAQVAPWSVLTPDGAVCAGLAGGEVAWAEEPAGQEGREGPEGLAASDG
ncbi:DUF6188 family protein [Kitasatospora sp. NBC_00085]|uniref:DUF6188 family protein n=1 Tax=unclassified Kitasatospora TaxID=2633591 RepID=UPI00324ADEA6